MPTPLLLGGNDFIFFNTNTNNQLDIKKKNDTKILGKGINNEKKNIIYSQIILSYNTITQLLSYLIIIFICIVIYLIYDEYCNNIYIKCY